MRRGPSRRGLQLFGKGISVHYGCWMDSTTNDRSVIEINEVNFCVVDTVLEKVDCAVMCKTKDSTCDQRRAYLKRAYFVKAQTIRKNLVAVLEGMRGVADLWTCTETGQIFAVDLFSGRAWYVHNFFESLD